MFILGSNFSDEINYDLLSLNDIEQDMARFILHFIGDKHSGKTSLMNAITNRTYESNFQFVDGLGLFKYSTTVVNTSINFGDNFRAGLGLWNNNQELHNLRHFLNKGRFPHAIVLVCDLTKCTSLENMQKNYDEVKKLIDETTFIYVVGTKKDSLHQLVSEHEVIDFAKQNNCNGVAFSSSKRNENIEQFFRACAIDLSVHYEIAKAIPLHSTDGACSHNSTPQSSFKL